jgi:ribonuclease Z
MYINYEIVVNEITEPGVIFANEDFYIRAFPLFHTKPCVGYTLEELPRPGVFYPEKAMELGVPKGSLWSTLQSGKSVETPDGRIVNSEDVMGPMRTGRKLSYVTDTLYHKSIAENVRGSDLLFCEGMFEAGMEDIAAEKKHMTVTQAAKIARDAHVKKMALLHYSPRYTDHELKNLLGQAQGVFENTVLTRDRMVFGVPYED